MTYDTEQQGEQTMAKVVYLDEKDAPPAPKVMSKTAKENLDIINGLKPGKVARVEVSEGQTLRGLKSGLTRVATNSGRKVVTYDDGEYAYVKLV